MCFGYFSFKKFDGKTTVEFVDKDKNLKINLHFVSFLLYKIFHQ